jgi:hypothetical protein
VDDATPERMFGSTTWAWKKVRVSRGAAGQQPARAKRARFWGLPARSPREPLHLTIKLRGGPECWVEVHARGRIARYHGATAIADIVFEVNQSDR